ncbi:hypothetical protein PUN28_002309 [Cardiocondyla obscurior]|uniref:Uncharacterized protein n=1 Tax=Cardiocondyla obscurior TaxID=286306 RepID=A0AAW2GTG7_9HYME
MERIHILLSSLRHRKRKASLITTTQSTAVNHVKYTRICGYAPQTRVIEIVQFYFLLQPKVPENDMCPLKFCRLTFQIFMLFTPLTIKYIIRTYVSLVICAFLINV